jgi:hypothetical protein
MMMHRFLPYPIQHTYTLQDFYRLQSPPYHLFLLSQQTLITYKILHLTSPAETNLVPASIDSLFSASSPHGSAPTNKVSRTIAEPVKQTLPNNNSTWSYSAEALLMGQNGTTFKYLPTGLIKTEKEGKEKEKEKDSKDSSKDSKDNKEALIEKLKKENDAAESLTKMTNPAPNELPDESRAIGQAFIRSEERPQVGLQVLRSVEQRAQGTNE